MAAYACRISKENLGAIASESPQFDRELTLQWLDEHKEGYFLRDDTSAFDCQYFETSIFLEIYMFEKGDEDALFRPVRRI